MHKLILILVILFMVEEKIKCSDGWYWRDYDGIIPDDAVPAGNNSKGYSYIGQAYLHNYGLLLGTIIPGKPTIDVPCYGVMTTDIMIKILCAGDKKQLYWLSTNVTSYKHDIVYRTPVLGGYDQKSKERTGFPLGTLHIGRIRKHGDVIIGNIAIYGKPDYVWFFYPLFGKEILGPEYEALMYSDGENIVNPV